jgi:ribosomal protein S13
MRKKHHLNKKFKRKQHLNTFVSAAYNQFYLKNNRLAQNFVSFFRKFHCLGIVATLRISSLLGVSPFLRFNTLNRHHVRKIFRMLALKFYINYSYIKEKKFELLKTLITFKMIRYYFSLPLRGQRTRTHAKTRKKYNIL